MILKMIVKIDNDKFKNLIRDLYNVYPNGAIAKDIEDVIKTEKVRNSLIDAGILLKDSVNNQGKNKDWYMLGPKGLSLISIWETEKLTQKMNCLTTIIVILTIIMVIF